MSAANDTTTDEPTQNWHALPGMLGDVITADEPTHVACGGYYVEKFEDGTIGIYREIDHAQTPEELEDEGDRMGEFYDFVTGNELVCKLTSPEDGWESEVSPLPQDIFAGYE